jgi:hypothetical protein
MERSDTHEDDPERRKDEKDIVGKMMNMIMSLRQELAELWTKNAVLENKLADKNNALPPSESGKEQPVVCGDDCVGEEAQQPPAHEDDGGEAVDCPEDTRALECVSPSDHGLEGAIV